MEFRSKSKWRWYPYRFQNLFLKLIKFSTKLWNDHDILKIPGYPQGRFQFEFQYGHDILNNLFSPKLPANIQFTSGTTGNPKAAALSHFNMINNAQSVINISNKVFYEDPTQDHSLPEPLCEHTVWNCLVPLYHVFGFVGVSVMSTLIKCEMGKVPIVLDLGIRGPWMTFKWPSDDPDFQGRSSFSWLI